MAGGRRASSAERVSTPTQRTRGDGRDAPAVAMLGIGWFPDTVGGAERYFRSLLEAMPEALGVVIGPATDAPVRLTAVSRADAPLARRVLGVPPRGSPRRRERRPDRRPLRALRSRRRCCSAGCGARRPSTTSTDPGPRRARSSAAAIATGSAAGSSGPCCAARAPTSSCPPRSGACSSSVTASRRGTSTCWRPGSSWSVSRPATAPPRAGAWASAEGAFLALTVRRLVPRTGVGELLDAWELAAGSCPRARPCSSPATARSQASSASGPGRSARARCGWRDA